MPNLDLKKLKGDIERLLIQPVEKVSIVKLVDSIILYAFAARASDIHIQPEETGIRIRCRIEGMLSDVFNRITISRRIHQEIVSRVKVMAGLRTDEHLAPQDGRLRVTSEKGDIDVRVSIMPTYHGENVVLRLLAETRDFTIDALGLEKEELARLKRALNRSYGMILANGPTGSGKTTTLYTFLKQLNRDDTSIITIEDPIEYALAGVTQIQVNNQVGLSFASGLRSILRQDPNVIMVGEIRDTETAGIAINAALTGHLVLSTLHTNDAATTFPRLIDMGVPPFLVASTINVVMGQRLIRTLCPACKKERKLNKEEVAGLAEAIPEASSLKGSFCAPVGCAKCDNTGFAGRIGVREVLEVTDDIRKLVMRRASAQDIKQAAVGQGMRTMIVDGLEKARQGIVPLEEVLRILHE